jgi:hypothetical protein
MTETPTPTSNARGGRIGPREYFFVAWGVVAVVLVAALLLSPSAAPGPATAAAPSYVGRSVPAGTLFSFLFTESVAIYRENLTGSASSPPVTIAVNGRWSSTAGTWVRLSMDGGSAPDCFAPVGCVDAAPTLSGVINLTAELPSNSASALGATSVTLYLQLWATGSDTLNVTVPIVASVAG